MVPQWWVACVAPPRWACVCGRGDAADCASAPSPQPGMACSGTVRWTTLVMPGLVAVLHLVVLPPIATLLPLLLQCMCMCMGRGWQGLILCPPQRTPCTPAPVGQVPLGLGAHTKIHSPARRLHRVP